MNNINEIIRSRRLELNMTMLDVAKIVGVSEGTVSRWESGDIENMRRDKIVSLAKALQISPAVIMGWEEMPEENNNKKNELTEDIVIYQRNGETMRKKLTKEQMDMLTAMLEAIPEDTNTDL